MILFNIVSTHGNGCAVNMGVSHEFVTTGKKKVLEKVEVKQRRRERTCRMTKSSGRFIIRAYL